MRRMIDGRIYDTETAELVASGHRGRWNRLRIEGVEPDPRRLRVGVLGVYYRRTKEGTRHAVLGADYILREVER